MKNRKKSQSYYAGKRRPDKYLRCNNDVDNYQCGSHKQVTLVTKLWWHLSQNCGDTCQESCGAVRENYQNTPAVIILKYKYKLINLKMEKIVLLCSWETVGHYSPFGSNFDFFFKER